MPVQVLNEPEIDFPVDVKIAVFNRNPKGSVLRFNGYDTEFPAGEAVIIDCQTAFAIFAVETRTPPDHVIKIRRDKTAGRQGTANSFYDECLIKYGATDPQGRVWFENFDFKLVKSTKKMAAMDFDKLK